MAYIETNLPPKKVFIKESALYDGDKTKTSLLPATLISLRSIVGENFSFQVLLENGALRDKVNISELSHKEKVDNPLPYDYLQLWDCFSYNFSLIEYNFLSGCKITTRLKNGKMMEGTYWFTIQWGGAIQHADKDITLSEDPMEHKSAHFIALDNGQFTFQPNNRIRVHEPSFVTKDFPDKPDWKVNSRSWKSEENAKWKTEDSDRWQYDIDTKI